MPAIRSLDKVLEALRLTSRQLNLLTEDPENHWRLVQMMVGGKKRPIRLPSPLLTSAQKRLLAGPLRTVPISPASYCEKGRGGVAAARLHAGHPTLLHLDIKSFFPSVTTARVRQELENVHFEPAAAGLIATLTTTSDQLPQGACTSVAIGNLVLGRLDGRISKLTNDRGLTYTRYVDDLAVSGGRRLGAVDGLIRRIIADEGWTIGGGKGGLFGVEDRHRYLGVIVNAKPNLSPDYVKDLRFLIGALSKNSSGHPNIRLLRKIWGRIRWLAAVNPERGKALLRRAIEVGLPDP